MTVIYISFGDSLVSTKQTLREKCPYSELFWSAFSHYSVSLFVFTPNEGENADQNNSQYGRFLRSEKRDTQGTYGKNTRDHLTDLT